MRIPQSPPVARIPFLMAFTAAVLLLPCQPVMAVERFWNVASGNWDINTNWTTATVPLAADTAQVQNGGLVNITTSAVATTVNVGYITAATNNRLVIANGGTLTTTGESTIGYSANTLGTVTVDGTWARGAGLLYLGRSGNGTLLVENGGSVSSTGSVRVGDNNGSVGSLTIDSGGSMTASSLAIANTGATSSGSVTVSGVNSSLTLSAGLTVGNNGTANLTVGTGGLVSSTGATTLGNNSTSSGTVLVRGTLTNTGAFNVGMAGTAATSVLTVGAGGVVNVASGAGTVNLGQGASAGIGILNLGGAVSGTTPGTAESAGVLNASTVAGNSSVSAVNFNHTTTDYYFTKTGLSGGSAIAIGGLTSVNYYSGKTTISGANTYTGVTRINGGIVNVGFAETPGVAGAGPLGRSAASNPGSIIFGGGTLQYSAANNNDYSGRFATTSQPIKIDTNGRSVTFSTPLMGTTNGSLALNDSNVSSGTLTLSASSGYTGGTTVTAGTLLLTNNDAAGSGAIDLTGISAASLRIASGVTIANNINFTNTNANSNVSRLVANSAAYTVGTSGNLTSSFVGGQPDTSAAILAGINSGSTVTLTMKFSATSAATNDIFRESDVFSLDGTTALDTFTLQLSVASLATDNFLGWLNGDTWVNAVAGNTGAGALAGAYTTSFATFVANNGGSFNAATMLGAYGVDVVGGTAWAVLNHNSDFAVIPEPGTAMLVTTAGALFFVMRRRRLKLKLD